MYSVHESDSSSRNWVKRGSLGVLAGLSLLCAAPAAMAQAMVTGFDATTFDGNDDESISASLGFTVNFYGNVGNTVFLNNNGNLTFVTSQNTFSPTAFSGLTRRMIAPFFADVDTRTAGNPVTYGTGTFGGRPAFGANWRNVDYYQGNAAHVNKNFFQVLLVDRSDVAANDFDIVFNYGQIQWESGTASGGNSSGLGGQSARAGYTAGTGAPGTFFELPGSGVPGSLLDSGTMPLIANSLNSGVNGRYIFNVRGGVINPVAPPAFDCSTLFPVVGQWGVTGGRCGNFVSTATAARYESTLFNGPLPPTSADGAGGSYVYDVQFVSNRPQQPTAATSIFVAGSPLPLRQSYQHWDQAIAFNVANGKYSIFRYNATAKPVPLQAWVVPVGVTFAAPPASNRLRVETQAGNLVFSINGVIVRTLPNPGVDQFGMGFVRSLATTGNLASDDWMEILGVTLTGAPPEVSRTPAQVSSAQQQANDAANASRAYQDPMFAPKR